MGCMLRSGGIILLREPMVEERLLTEKCYEAFKNKTTKAMKS